MFFISSFVKGVIFCLLFSFSLKLHLITPLGASEGTTVLSYGNDPIPGELPDEGYAKVRIWKTSLPKRAGHVSLETKNSHISVWPNSNAEGIAKIERITDGFSPVIHAPALNAKNYEKDFVSEGNMAPDYVFLIGVNSEKIDENWGIIRELYADPLEDGFIPLRNVTWLAPSGSSFPPPTLGSIHVNCASAVLLALGIGGIDIKSFVTKKNAATRLTRSTADLLSSTPEHARELLQGIGLWSFYDSVIKPDDIAALLETVMEERTRERLVQAIEQGSLGLLGIDEKKRSIAIDEIVKRLPSRRNEIEYIELSNIGTLKSKADGTETLILKKGVIKEINRIYKNQISAVVGVLGAGVGGLIGSAIGGKNGAAAGAIIGGSGGVAASKGCSIM